MDSLFFDNIRKNVGPQTKIIFLISDSAIVNKDVTFTLDYLFDNQFSKIFQDKNIRESSSLIISSHFSDKLYLSTILNKPLIDIEKEIKKTLPLAQLSADNEVMIIHSETIKENNIKQFLSTQKVNFLTF